MSFLFWSLLCQRLFKNTCTIVIFPFCPFSSLSKLFGLFLVTMFSLVQVTHAGRQFIWNIHGDVGGTLCNSCGLSVSVWPKVGLATNFVFIICLTGALFNAAMSLDNVWMLQCNAPRAKNATNKPTQKLSYVGANHYPIFLDVLVFHTLLPCPSICRRLKKLPRLLWERIWSCARPPKARLDAFECSFLETTLQDPNSYSDAKARYFSYPTSSLRVNWAHCQIVLGVAGQTCEKDVTHIMWWDILHQAEISQWTVELHTHSHCALMTNSWALACFAATTYLLVTPLPALVGNNRVCIGWTGWRGRC